MFNSCQKALMLAVWISIAELVAQLDVYVSHNWLCSIFPCIYDSGKIFARFVCIKLFLVFWFRPFHFVLQNESDHVTLILNFEWIWLLNVISVKTVMNANLNVRTIQSRALNMHKWRLAITKRQFIFFHQVIFCNLIYLFEKGIGKVKKVIPFCFSPPFLSSSIPPLLLHLFKSLKLIEFFLHSYCLNI